MDKRDLERGHFDNTVAALVVDDEAAICEYMSDVLRGMGIDAYCAGTVEAALDIADSKLSLDVAFVDLSLPDRTGLELISELRKLRPQLPIVLATAYAGMAKADLEESSTFQLALEKPYDEAAVALVLARLQIPVSMPPGSSPSAGASRI